MSACKSVSLSLRYFARLWTDHHSKSLRVRVDTGGPIPTALRAKPEASFCRPRLKLRLL
jgi:hypothetical protein